MLKGYVTGSHQQVDIINTLLTRQSTCMCSTRALKSTVASWTESAKGIPQGTSNWGLGEGGGEGHEAVILFILVPDSIKHFLSLPCSEPLLSNTNYHLMHLSFLFNGWEPTTWYNVLRKCNCNYAFVWKMTHRFLEPSENDLSKILWLVSVLQINYLPQSRHWQITIFYSTSSKYC